MTVSIALAIATVLGALSFFEPCTVATHTLFSARSHARRGSARCRELLTLWGVRSLLSVGLLLVSVALAAPFRFGAYLPSIALAVIASVYLVSRVAYLPVPHLEFWRLLPGGASRAPVVKLGLTLPACTLPLFVIVAAVTSALDSWLAALGAGMLFAALFTAPTVVTASLGLSARGRRFLSGAALATPYLTAALLYGAAVCLLP